MTGGDDIDPLDHGVAGGPVRHVPVLREEVMAALAVEPGLYLDATFGAGGYTRAILATAGTRVLALDRDPAAVAGGATLKAAYPERLDLVQARFAEMTAIAAERALGAFDGVAMDIGVSSMQIDEADRGFSFRQDGPLDMRMGEADRTAAQIIDEASEEALADILYYYGEERAARRIARAIVADRKASPFETTRQLAELIARIVPHKPTDIHPATRAFQALRIAVNNELEELVAGLQAAERLLAPGGRLAVVTFHSLEDRIVKTFFAKRSGKGESKGRRLPGERAPSTPSFDCPRGQPVTPSADELAGNPRARSAKLRFGTRTDAAAAAIDDGLFNLARLPNVASKIGAGR
jgi:16S rRNA (cytosine1402-N4)-methyltransferase